ncbi:hypothetical protein ACF1A5_16410 [Streptomyces sp. NPDC014864]|uniref:hypothetical protein n=1 Tax=Streptomyces sp. NPDC014864 TaxID=3364924 RepID=UPI0036FA7FCA
MTDVSDQWEGRGRRTGTARASRDPSAPAGAPWPKRYPDGQIPDNPVFLPVHGAAVVPAAAEADAPAVGRGAFASGARLGFGAETAAFVRVAPHLAIPAGQRAPA